MSREITLPAQDADSAHPLLPEGATLPWDRYDQLRVEATVLLPLHPIALADLARIIPGTVFRTLHSAADDVFLSIDSVFVAHGAFEPAEGKLGLRVNELQIEEPSQTGRVRVSNLASPDETALPHLALSDVLVPLAICFGRKTWTLGEALKISPGDLLQLDRDLEGLVELTADGRIIASGILLLSDGFYCLQINSCSFSENLEVELPVRKVVRLPSRVADPAQLQASAMLVSRRASSDGAAWCTVPNH